jgi:PAS domain S-box-containing protein
MTERTGKETRQNMPGFARKFFAPSVYIMNRLKYLKKFILISACFAVPIAVSMFLLIDKNIDYWRGFTRKEAEGVRNISRIRKLHDDVQTHRALAMILAAGDAGARGMLMSSESEVDSELKDLNGVVESGSSAEKKWKEIKDEWQKLKGTGRGLPADEIYEQYNDLVRDLRILVEMESYDSDLILDPDSQSFLYINLIVRDLPRLTERIKRVNALGSYALVRKKLAPGEKERLISVSGEVRGSIDVLKVDREILAGQPGAETDPALLKITAYIDTIIAGSENYLKLVDTMITNAKRPDMPPWEFFNTSRAAFFTPIGETYDASGAALSDIFSARTRHLNGQSLVAWGVTIIVVALVLYLLAGLYISVIDTVSKLGIATRQMSLTGLPETISLESRDELNEVVMLFNKVAIALRRSHEVLLHSERLALLGSWDMDTATKTMDWSPGMYRIYRIGPAEPPAVRLEALFLKVHPDDAVMVRENIEKGISAGNIPLFEYRLLLEDGSARHLSCEGKARPYGDGKPFRITGFVQDITDRKKAEEEMLEALGKVKQLSGLLPICASCKKIRNDKGYWESIEKYIESHSEAEFSHSICDDCVKKLYPDFHRRQPDNTG